jgi:hypothetical protein
VNVIYFLAQATKIDPNTIGVHKIDDANAALAGVLNTMYAWAGIVAVLVIVVAGFYFVTASGEAAIIKRAREAIIGACIGLIVILMAFVGTQFVLGRFF